MTGPIRIPLTKIVGNRGQIEGVPENPRQWDTTDVDRLAQSILDTPLLAEARPLLVCMHGGKYVVLGGNLRLEAYKRNKAKDAPCIIMEGSAALLREVALKDNASFGEWDIDELANKWGHLPLSSWGVDVADLDGGSDYTGTNKELDTDGWSEDMTMKLRFTPEELAWVKQRLQGKDARKEILTALGYYDGDEEEG